MAYIYIVSYLYCIASLQFTYYHLIFFMSQMTFCMFWLFCFGPLVFLLPKIFFLNYLDLSVPDENEIITETRHALNLFSTFLLNNCVVTGLELKRRSLYTMEQDKETDICDSWN